ncbi:MAG: DUF3611 family protein [Hyphomicrobiaceae bacterium]
MSDKVNSGGARVDDSRLAGQFRRLGWIGFWIQIVLLIFPIALVLYVLVLSSPTSANSAGINLRNYLSYGGLLVLVFTTAWFYRYTRLGRKMSESFDPPMVADVLRIVWVGIWAGCVGVGFSMLMLVHTVSRMLFTLLATPQIGLIVAPSSGGDPTQSVSAADAVSLTAVVLVLAAELIVLGLSLWLLYRTAKLTGDFGKATT